MLLIFPVHIVSHTLFPQINVCSENETKIARQFRTVQSHTYHQLVVQLAATVLSSMQESLLYHT